MGLWIEISITNILIFGALCFVLKKAIKIMKAKKYAKDLEKWNSTPKNKVILHMLPRAKTIPSASPFVLKLETYLRMANIPYEVDTNSPWGSKGKTPWITYNGTHVADSQLCIEFLNKKLDKDLSKRLTPEQKAIARLARVSIENHFLWGFAHWRWIEKLHTLTKVMVMPWYLEIMFKLFAAKKVKNMLEVQGLGRHSVDELTKMTGDDLRAVSTVLGKKKFLMGDEPCEEDCALFGMLSQLVWAAPETPYERLVNGELSNLKEYCLRIKDKYYSDWDKCLHKVNS